MGRWQPYLYNADARQSVHDVPDVFNPKAVTMASRQPPTSKPKQNGPLVNFNQHPDSYLILPYGKTDVKPMSANVKSFIKTARWIQFCCRLLNMLGAVGALICSIFIRGAADTEGYIMRIPPGVDIVFTLYAVYHLLRAAKARTPASSASYHFFALVFDAGFVPFYVFTALLAKRNYNEEAGTLGRWRTFFPTDEETAKVLNATWLIATIVGGLHCLSIALDLYLVVMFRRITRLPPDMNPLEDNLTSRRKTKHKHKDSSLSALTPLTADEHCSSMQSASTTIVGSRKSQADTLTSGIDIPHPDDVKVPFMHTRTLSDVTYSPHTPESARQSRLSVYSQPASARQSRGDLHRREDLYRQDDGSDNETLAQRKSLLAQQAIKRHSRPNSMVSSKQEYYTSPTTAEKHASSGDISLQNSIEDLRSDNWFVHEDSVQDEAEAQHYSPGKQSVFTSRAQAKGYNAIATYEDVSDEELEPPMMPQPLRMNPPTPPPAKTFTSELSETSRPTLQRTPTTISVSTDATFTRSHSRASTPKSRYYGDLKAATQGVRNGESPASSPGHSPQKMNFGPNHFPSTAKAYTTNSPSAASNFAKNSPFSLDKKTFSSVRRTGEANHVPVKAQSPRVVSRTGVDYVGNYAFDDEVLALGTPGRGRNVSGKIAEEGRGGLGGLAGRWGGMGMPGFGENGLTYRKVSGVA